MYNNNNWLSKLNRRFGRYAISNLMLYIVIGQAIVYGFESDMAIPFSAQLVPTHWMCLTSSHLVGSIHRLLWREPTQRLVCCPRTRSFSFIVSFLSPAEGPSQ